MIPIQNAHQRPLFLFVATALLGIGAGSPPAHADDASRLDVQVAPGVRWVMLPEVEGGLQAPSSPVGSSPDDAVGWGIDGRVAYQLGEGLSPLGAAAVAVRVRTTFADADEKVATGGAYGQMPVNGSGPSNGGPGGTAFSSFEYDRYDADLVYQVALDAGPVAVRPLFGFTYSRLDQSHEFRAAPSNGFEIDDDVASNYYGGVLGVDGEIGIVHGLRANAGFEVGLLAADSELDVDQLFGGPTISAGDEKTDFAWRTRGALGLRWTFLDHFSVGAEGTVDWERIHVPQHPLRDGRPFESKLTTDDALVVGGNLTVAVAF